MLEFIEPASAKVNLYLHVVGRRDDGLHLLDSLAVFPPIGDEVRAAADDGMWLQLAGPFGDALRRVPDNLVMRAARALAAENDIPPRARIVLEKNLPVASGIGGGSADAAAALRALSRLWQVPAASPALALALGADVPVCLASRPTRMGGVGEILTEAPDVPACGIVLVNPGVEVRTPDVFRTRQGGFSPAATLPARWPGFAAMVADLARLTNDLEPPAIALCPPIAEALAALRAQPGCALARMSGSGATCFGLFADAPAATRAAAALGQAGWWHWGGDLGVRS